jgi:hypothetical protein
MAFISNGTTMLDAGAFSVSLGAMTHIKTLTASNSADLSFIDGSSSVVLDSTYPIYLFKYINMHPATNDVEFYFNTSTNSGGAYNTVKTTTVVRASHAENGSGGALSYITGNDEAQSSGAQQIGQSGNDNDHGVSGELYLFNPSSTTFVKHFLCQTNYPDHGDESHFHHYAGYLNTTTAVDAVQFTFSSGNIDAGTIKLYGIKDS